MAVLEYVTGTLESARRQADRVVTPDTRQRAYETVHAFAQQRPLLFVCSILCQPQNKRNEPE